MVKSRSLLLKSPYYGFLKNTFHAVCDVVVVCEIKPTAKFKS